MIRSGVRSIIAWLGRIDLFRLPLLKQDIEMGRSRNSRVKQEGVRPVKRSREGVRSAKRSREGVRLIKRSRERVRSRRCLLLEEAKQGGTTTWVARPHRKPRPLPRNP